MSSPIAIPRSHVATQHPHEVSSLSSSGSQTGLYIPIHKRGTSSVSSSPSPPPTSTHRTTHSQSRNSHSGSRSPAKGGRLIPIRHDHNDNVKKGPSDDGKFLLGCSSQNRELMLIPVESHIPHNTMIPNHNNHHYSISDLFALAPLARLSPSQLESVHNVIDIVSTASPSAQQSSRRRRTGQGRQQKPKAQRVSAAMTEGPRRRGIWGWNPHQEAVQQVAEVTEEGNWRHSPALVSSQA